MPSPQYVTIAQALASSQSGLLVQDSAANIAAALPNAGLTTRVMSFSLLSNAVINAATADKLATLGSKFAPGSTQIVVQDTVAAMNAASNASGLAIATSRQIVDAAYNLLAAPTSTFANIASVTLTGSPSLSMAQLTKLEGLPSFSVQTGSQVTLQDSLTDFVPVLSAHASWFTAATTLSVRLDGSQIGAAGISALAALATAGKTIGFVAGSSDTTLNVTATAHDLAGAASSINQIGALVGLHLTVSNDGSAVSAADAAALQTITGFSPSGHTLYVSDTGAAITTNAAALFGHGFAQIVVASGNFTGTATQLLDTTLHFGGGATATMSGIATVVAADAQTLGILPGFTLASGAAMNVSDTVSNLLSHASGLGAATSITATAGGTVSAAGAATLAVLSAAHAGHFSLGGNSVAVSDTAANLAALSVPAIALGTSFALSASGVVTASQFTALRDSLNVGLNGHTLTIDDTAGALLALSGSLSLATACILSGPATVSVAAIQSLATEPGFSTGGYTLTVSDSAANLIGLSSSMQALASSLTLSAAQSVSASQLTGLVGLGSKFSTGGYAVTVTGNATDLAALTPSALALVHAAQLTTSATLSAAAATALVSLPGFSVGGSTALTVQDSAANLLTLSTGVLAAAGTEKLTAGAVTLGASAAAGLNALAHFTTTGATITVSDTVADLTASANTGWQSVAAATHIVDTAAALAAASGTALVQGAGSVTLSANATVTAAQAASLATITGYATGSFALTVSDGAAAIATNEAAIAQVGTTAVVTDTGPLNASQADTLALLSAAGKLTFPGGSGLSVVDSYANLTASANSTGLALATSLTVIDTAANLLAAASHNWGSRFPTYELSSNAVVTAAQATTLAGLGSHFLLNGHALSVQDGAAAVAGAQPSLSSLGITANVVDSAAAIASNASTLSALGAMLTTVRATNTTAVSGATAAALSPLAGKLTGSALPVQDSAANINTNLSGLVTLGSHVAVTVLDSAASIGPNATALATLGAAVTVTLTDSSAVTAATAAAIAPLSTHMHSGTALAITDTAANVAAQTTSLQALTGSLGTITLSGGYALSVAQAVALQPLDSHLPPGQIVTISGSAAAIATNHAAIAQFVTDGHVTAVLDSNETAAAAAANATGLNQAGATVTISDTQAAIISAMAGLSTLTGLTGVTVTDVSNPVFTLSISQYAADAAVLAHVTNTHSIAISDTAAAIASDLGSSSSVLAGITGTLSIAATGGTPVVLSQTVALTPTVSAALAHLSTPLQVTAVDVAHLSSVVALSPASLTLSDTAASIQADLTGGSSLLVADLASISAITVAPSGTITLSAAQALTSHVDDTAGSVFGLMSGGSLAVTGATVAQLTPLLALHAAPGTIAVNDTAANITAALTNSASPVLTAASSILSLHVSDGAPIVLTAAQDLAAGVNDSASAALDKVTNASLDVTGVGMSQLGAVEATLGQPALVNVSDTAANLASGLSTLLTDLPNLGAIAVTSGTVTLTYAQATTAHVADGAGSLVSLLPSHAYAVTGATIAQMPALAALAQAPTSIAVTDSSANLVADLTGSTSQWHSHANTVTVTGGTLTMTDAQAHAVITASRSSDLHDLVSGTILNVTGATISDLSALSAISSSLAGGVSLRLEVTDTAASLAADLASGSSVLTADAAYVHSVALTASGGTLTPSQLGLVAGISGLNANGVTVPVGGTAAAVAGMNAATVALAGTIAVSDTSSNVATQFGALQTLLNGHLSITLTNGSPSITLTAANYAADAPTVAAITNTSCVTVTGDATAIGGVASALASDTHIAAVQVTDTAYNVVGILGAISGFGALTSVTLTDSGSISATMAQALGASNIGTLHATSIVVSDTGAQLAAALESGTGAGIIQTLGAQLSANSNVSVLDASALYTYRSYISLNSHTVNVWDTAAHLTQPGVAATLSTLVGSGLVSSIYLKTTGNAVTLTAANAIALLAISGLIVHNPDSSANVITVSDTAAHLDTNYTTLNNDIASIGHFVINASATVAGATLTHMQTLGAIAASGVSLTLSDTASNILSAAAVSSPSVQAGTYSLSGNASITSAQAISLAALSNFNAGSYTMTVALGSDSSVSVAQANNLGGLGSALVVTGHHFTVSGSVSGLAGLTAAGASAAHVGVTDTLANIGALTSASPLLGGNITISDSEGLTATQAGAFLSLMSAAGVASGAISFGAQTETVTDNIAAIQALKSSAAWTGNSGLQSHFSLVANDTAANLSNSANATFLNGLAGQVLSAASSVNAATASTLAGLSNFSRGGNALIVSDTAANLLATGASAGIAVATSVTLSGAASLNSTGAESLLQLSNFHLTQGLTITDSSGNLLDGTLSGLIAGRAQVSVALAGNETLDAQTASALVALQGFSDTTHMAIVDSSSYLLAAGASAAEMMAASVSLSGNEVVSANTVLRLSQIAHFSDSGGTLTLAGNDFANAPTLKAIADLGSNFAEGGHSLTLTQDDLTLTPTEFTAISTAGLVANGHLVSAELVNNTITDTGNVMSLSSTGVVGATVQVYGSTGALISTTTETNANFTVTASDLTGTTFSVTEKINGVESAPVVVLDQAALESAVSGATATFASSGQIQVDAGKFINLYTAGATLPNAPALVYDPHAHTISLDIPSQTPVTLITLGAGTTPASIDPTEILVKHHS